MKSRHRIALVAAALLASLFVATGGPAVADDATPPTNEVTASQTDTGAGDTAAATDKTDDAPAPAEDKAPSDEKAPADDTAGGEQASDESAADLTNSVDAALTPQSLMSSFAAFTSGANTVTVNSLNTVGDNSVGDGICDTGATVSSGDPECTLRAALEEANAVDIGDLNAPSSVSIDFDVTGMLEIDGAGDANRMYTSTVGHWYDWLGSGAAFYVNSPVPVTINFAGIDGIEHTFDSWNAGIYVHSNDVVLKNLAQLRAGEAGIAVDGKNVQITNVHINDPDTIISENGIALLDGATNVTITDAEITSQVFQGIVVDNLATVSNIVVNNLTSRGQGRAHIGFHDGSTVNGFQINNSTLGNVAETSPSQLLWVYPSVTTSNVTISGSTFSSPNAMGVAFNGGGITMTNTTIKNSTFTGTGRAVDGSGSAAHLEGLTIEGNTFTDLLLGTLYFENVFINDGSITGNTFTDGRGGALATLDLGHVSNDSVISGNTFTMDSTKGDPNRWAILQDYWDAAAGVNTGWTIRNNHIDGYFPIGSAPISNFTTGDSIVEQNTFGPGTRGTTDTESEYGPVWFVANLGNANGLIQTWRPTVAAFGNDKVTVTVAPVNPPLGANTAPTGPVAIDVYWTAADNAETYVGRISDVSGTKTATLPWTGGAGFIRVQTIDAQGRSSQYSGVVQVAQDTTPPAAPKVDSSPLKGALKGTGEPGATVDVTNAAGDVVCSTTVDDEGNWECSPEEELKCGTTYAVAQTDALGNVSEPSKFKTAKCATNAGSAKDSDNKSLPDTGAPEGLWLFAALGLTLAGGGVLALTARGQRRRKQMI